jgi:hypothetical protein
MLSCAQECLKSLEPARIKMWVDAENGVFNAECICNMILVKLCGFNYEITKEQLYQAYSFRTFSTCLFNFLRNTSRAFHQVIK